MKALTIEKQAEIFAAVGIKLIKPLQEEKIENFIQTFPLRLRQRAEQISSEISVYGYRIIKFISKCRNGFVFAANKGRVRFAIKAQLNRVETDDGEINMLLKNRELPDNLKFYNNPYILSYIDSFETVDFHYTVTEECRCNLSDFIKQVNIKYNEDTPLCFNRYAFQLLIALKQLQTGPEHPNSSRFVSHIRPEDILINYNSEIRLNPNFGESQVTLGIIPFCNSQFSSNQMNVSCINRFSVSYAHLLLYINGMQEKDILTNWLKQSSYRMGYRSDGLDSVSSRIISNKQENYEQLKDVYKPDSDQGNQTLVLRLKQNLDRICEQYYVDNQGETVYALGKGKCITAQQYNQLYELSQVQCSEEQKEQIGEQLDEEMNRIEKKYRRILFVQEILNAGQSQRSRRSSTQRDIERLKQKLINLLKSFFSMQQKLAQFVEKKNRQLKQAVVNDGGEDEQNLEETLSKQPQLVFLKQNSVEALNAPKLNPLPIIEMKAYKD
ncbi:hypothetical protein TTHERM_000156669 (macronuclear) [Tetrahymena thermophila SB210]|uniref:Protein kinase domain-containing protein n=1 Tax=Tetrahymena thermophila (strain SB210) TaxID=312017 RepID=W7XLB3_TETTS|nr:hypothetical protein TTHERM_000156669 [Tetrahymena thermophila SB210]EWS75989.1 hypothetical protein TTHERM_000156669 [Tetrahymena thermophila SB210]|eukprot:XP_012651507.1 hypothetical protein TTHERM_000156669 [Tetrahymena thermophila SB210]